MPVKRTLLVSLGAICVGLGTLGIFLPLLPTTPLLLLAAYLFARSSDRWNRWLLDHKHLGPYIHAVRSKQGLTRAQKLRIGLSFSVFFGVSIYYVPLLTVRIALAAWWLFWIVYILRIKTATVPALAQAGEDS